MPPQFWRINMRDQTAALKYLAEKQFERGERKHKRDLILVAYTSTRSDDGRSDDGYYSSLTQPRFGGVFFALIF
jgi:hypothetical protein